MAALFRFPLGQVAGQGQLSGLLAQLLSFA